MAYNESTVGGSYGGNYRVWVNSIRTFDGDQSNNSEDWRVEGGLNKVGGGTAYNNSNQASYTLQLGLNGVASSGRFNYNFGSGTGRVLAWGTGATKVYRNSAGVGFGFQSRMDINLANGSVLTSGWVTSNDSVQTKYRQAYLTNLSQDITDMDDPWVEFGNPAGAYIRAWFEFPYLTGGARYLQYNGVGSRFTWVLDEASRNVLRNVAKNYNDSVIRYVIETDLGNGQIYGDWRDRNYKVIDAQPEFTNFTYLDTNSTTTAITGNNQVLIQGKSNLSVTVPLANKAIAKKMADMQTYAVTIGGYAQSPAWSNTADVTHVVGAVSDVTGQQSLAVRAVDTRSNGTSVSKTVTVVPYSTPIINPQLSVNYTNDYNSDAGISVVFPGSFGSVAPVTIGGTDKNTVVPASGLKIDLSKGGNTAYSGTMVNIPTTQASSTGVISVVTANLQGAILGKMNAMGVDNTQIWYVKFQLTDKLETKTYEAKIDIGRSIFRIGTDGYVYNNEVKMLTADDSTNIWLQGEISNTTSTGARGILVPTGSGYNSIPGSKINIAQPLGQSYTVCIAPAKGVYKIDYLQLVNPSGDGYYALQVNETTVKYAFVIGGRMQDYGDTWMGVLNKNDRVRLYNDAPITTAWSGAHSSFNMHMTARLP